MPSTDTAAPTEQPTDERRRIRSAIHVADLRAAQTGQSPADTFPDALAELDAWLASNELKPASWCYSVLVNGDTLEAVYVVPIDETDAARQFPIGRASVVSVQTFGKVDEPVTATVVVPLRVPPPAEWIAEPGEVDDRT